MALPTKSVLDYSYTGFQQSQGDSSFPGMQIDNDLANLKATTDELVDFIGETFRSDGVLQAGSLPSTSDIADLADIATVAAASAAASAVSTASDKVSTAANAVTTTSNVAAALAAANQAAGFAAQAGASSGVDTSGLATKAANLSDLVDKPAARSNLGLHALALLDTADFANLTATVQAMLNPTGKIGHFLLSAAPTGWVAANGGTIGGALSGGTTRANADTSALFAAVWALDATNFPIVTSTGVASTRGANAATDFAASKRLPLPDLRAEFIRGLDSSRAVDAARVLGSAQAEMIGPHTHTGTTDTTPAHTHTVTAYGSGAGAVVGNGSTAIQNTARATSPAGAHSHTLTINNNSGTENRVRNVALLACIKL